MVEGIVAAAVCLIISTASPSAYPGFRLKEMVTDGSWPVCAITEGPTLVRTLATVFSGISRPALDRT